jgi:hypothetical protein
MARLFRVCYKPALRGDLRIAIPAGGKMARRMTPSLWARSAYAVEYNPWTTCDQVEEALFFRGAIVSAFGQVETLLGDLCIRASRLPQYESLRQSFPRSAEKRVSFLRDAFSIYPLSSYRVIAYQFLDRFSATANTRHMMAHARMQVMDKQVTFHDFPRTSNVSITLRRQPFSLVELEAIAWRSARLGRLAHRLLNRLNRADVLPTIE